MQLYIEKKSGKEVLFDFVEEDDFLRAKAARGEIVDPDEFAESMLLVSADRLKEDGIVIQKKGPVTIPDNIVCEWAKTGVESDSAIIWLEVKAH